MYSIILEGYPFGKMNWVRLERWVAKRNTAEDTAIILASVANTGGWKASSLEIKKTVVSRGGNRA